MQGKQQKKNECSIISSVKYSLLTLSICFALPKQDRLTQRRTHCFSWYRSVTTLFVFWLYEPVSSWPASKHFTVCLSGCVQTSPHSNMNASWSRILNFFFSLPFQFYCHLHFGDFNNCTAMNRQHTKTNQKHLSGKLQCWESSDNGLSLAYKTGSRCLWQKNGRGSPLFKLWPCNVIKRRFVQMAVIQGLKDKISSRFSKKR